MNSLKIKTILAKVRSQEKMSRNIAISALKVKPFPTESTDTYGCLSNELEALACLYKEHITLLDQNQKWSN